jgi:hypothetical protein
MNDDDLRQRLRKLEAPEASESTRARARHRALTAFQQGCSMRSQELAGQGFAWWWRSALALVLAVGVGAFSIFKHQDAVENLTNDRKILQQVEKLFPNQVDAVVEQNGKIDLSIAQSPVVGSDQPVLVVFKQGSDTIRVLSYSGHRVCLLLGNRQSCFEVLATPTGSVILEGENKVWTASEHPEMAGYSVRAQTLEASL